MTDTPSDRLRRIRLAAPDRPSMRKWSMRIGIGYDTYKSIENGTRPLTLETAITLGEKLGRHPAWLLWGDEIGTALTPRQKALLHSFELAPEPVKRSIQAALSPFDQPKTEPITASNH